MPDVSLGVVSAIDRAANRVRAFLDSGAEISAAYFARGGREPWPLCTATFVNNGGAWLCQGPVGDRRRVVDDDFTYVTAATATGRVDCDEPWNLDVTTAASTAQATPAGTEAQGAVRVRAVSGAAAAAALFRKDTRAIGLPVTAYWATGRFAFAGVATDTSRRVGLFDGTGGADAAMVGVTTFGGATTLFFLTRGGGGATDAALGVVPIENQWYWLDLVLAPGFAAAWLDGDGPYVNTTNLPAVALTLAARVNPDPPNATADIFLDTFRLAVIDRVNDPTGFAVGLGSAAGSNA